MDSIGDGRLAGGGVPLFVGPHTIELKDISEITAFPDSFAVLCAAAYWVGTIPWCTFSIILRDHPRVRGHEGGQSHPGCIMAFEPSPAQASLSKWPSASTSLHWTLR